LSARLIPLQSDADSSNYEQSQLAAKYVLVAGTFRSFSDARIEAIAIARSVGLEYRPQLMAPATGQPTYSRSVCEANGWDYPCYVARGRYDDGAYLSVEPSNEYGEMRPGYFVVVACSGTMKEVAHAQRLLNGRHLLSVVRRVTVWMGCIH
jgi:hypothetical protein